MTIDTLMIFAAGRGTRMQHLTIDKPKSLIEIQGKPILHHILELSLTYSFKKIVINSHYLHKQIHKSINDFRKKFRSIKLPEIIEIYEPELLETGGAVKNATKIIGENPIFTINSDVIINSNENIFSKLASQWDHKKMDFLLLLQSYDEAIGYRGNGDFNIGNDGKLERPDSMNNYNYMYAGLAILKPRVINLNSKTTFSLQDYYLNSDKVYGCPIENCKWYHVNSPEDLKKIELDLDKV